MKGDFSRRTFDSRKHYSAVLQEQGRMLTDADLDEQHRIATHRIEAEAVDLIGRSGGPIGEAGFEILCDGSSVSIGAGRYYVDGVLVENEERIDFSEQRHGLEAQWPPDDGPGRYVVYLDAWRRLVTALDDPSVREVALGGPTTSAREQIAWRVRAARIGDDVTCPDAVPALPATTGMIAVRADPGREMTAPCDVPPRAEYIGLENQFYRVEIHDSGDVESAGGGEYSVIRFSSDAENRVTLDKTTGLAVGQPVEMSSGSSSSEPVFAYITEIDGTDLVLSGAISGFSESDTPRLVAGTATFVWSRDNGSVVSSVSDISPDGLEIGVDDLGKDDVLGFAPDDLVELTDDRNGQDGKPGQLLRIASIDRARSVVVLRTPAEPLVSPTGNGSGVNPDWHPKLRRWEGGGLVRPGSASAGDQWISLEDGIQVRSTDGGYRTGDYWHFPARTATIHRTLGNIEWPRDASGDPALLPPHGVTHHYAPLAIVNLGHGDEEGRWNDLRDLYRVPQDDFESAAARLAKVLGNDPAGARTALADRVRRRLHAHGGADVFGRLESALRRDPYDEDAVRGVLLAIRDEPRTEIVAFLERPGDRWKDLGRLFRTVREDDFEGASRMLADELLQDDGGRRQALAERIIRRQEDLDRALDESEHELLSRFVESLVQGDPDAVHDSLMKLRDAFASREDAELVFFDTPGGRWWDLRDLYRRTPDEDFGEAARDFATALSADAEYGRKALAGQLRAALVSLGNASDEEEIDAWSGLADAIVDGDPDAIHELLERVRDLWRKGSFLLLAIQVQGESDCRTLFPAVTSLTNLLYAGGDGQEGLIDPDQPTLPLPTPLRVRVVNGGVPVAGATIEFEASSGELDGTGPGPWRRPTGSDGLASCAWALEAGGPVDQSCIARLIGPDGSPVPGQEVRFGARRMTASRIAYDPANCSNLTSTRTVQEAIDALCAQDGSNGCSISVGSGGRYPDIRTALEELRERGETDVELGLLAGEHSLEAFDYVVDDPRQELTLSIAPCGPSARLILDGDIRFSGLEKLSISGVECELRAGAQLRATRCGAVDIDRCRFSGLTPLVDDGYRGLVRLRETGSVSVGNTTFECLLDESLTPAMELFRDANDDVARLFSITADREFRATASEVSARLCRDDPGDREKLAELLLERMEKGSEELTQGEQDAYRRLRQSLGGDQPDPMPVADALRGLRSALVQAAPGVALEIGEYADEEAGDGKFASFGRVGTVTLENNTVTGIVSLYGESRPDQQIDHERLMEWREKLQAGEFRLRGGGSTAHLHGNRLTRLIVGEAMLQALDQFPDPVPAGLLSSLILGDNVIHGADSQLVARHLSLAGNEFTLAAVRSPQADDPDRGVADVVADSAVYTGNHGQRDGFSAQICDASRTLSASGNLELTFCMGISPDSLPRGDVGAPYNATLHGIGGEEPFTFAVAAGALPTGVTLSAQGVLGGKPTKAGSYGFTVRVTDTKGRTGSHRYTVGVGLTLTPTLPDGMVRIAYNRTLQTSGGTAPFTFAVTSGALPAGLKLESTGKIAGTPEGAGRFTFEVEATDAQGQKGSQSYTVGIALNVEPLTLASGEVGLPYSDRVKGIGGKAPYAFAIQSGTRPPGLSLSNDGVLSGTPTQEGQHRFTARVTDAAGNAGSREVTVSIAAMVDIVLAPEELPSARLDHAYGQEIIASGGTGPYTFWSSGELPPGLSLSEGGMISGTPYKPASYAFEVFAADTNDRRCTRAYTIEVAEDVLVLMPQTLGRPDWDRAYSARLWVEGGFPDYRFRISSGHLPQGLTLSDDGWIRGVMWSAAGLTSGERTAIADVERLRGTTRATDGSHSIDSINDDGPLPPKIPVFYAFEVEATDARGRTASRKYTWHWRADEV